jgi:hypothetical protein
VSVASGAEREATLALVAEIEGWLTEAQARRLWHVAAGIAPGGQIVEIGSFRGRSTIALAAAAPAGVPVTAIDPHLGGDRGPQEIDAVAVRGSADHAAFVANLQRSGVAARVRHVRARSQQALDDVPGEITLLFVDGAHRFGPASEDLRRWGGRVTGGGTLLVHDSFSSIGVTGALFAHVIGREGWRYRGRDGSLAEYRRGPALTRPQAAAELARGLSQLPWFVRNLAIKALLLTGRPGAARRLGHRTGPWPH